MKEHKIGEIFEYNGEWYQRVEGDSCGECSLFTTECRSGTKSDLADKVVGQCCKVRRTDNKHVIFKKLEKVGEPYEYFIQGVGIIMVQEYILANADYIWEYSQDVVVMDCQNGKVAIEIKQTKEDMEEKKFCEETSKANEVNMIFKIASKYINGGTTYDEFDEAMRNWINGSEKDEHILKEFDLEAAKAGKPVCTRDGRKARIICFDAKFPKTGNIIALIEKENGEEVIFYYNNNGQANLSKNYDLMMLPEKKEGWVNVYKGIDGVTFSKHPYTSKDEAIKKSGILFGRIDTIKVSWEE